MKKKPWRRKQQNKQIDANVSTFEQKEEKKKRIYRTTACLYGYYERKWAFKTVPTDRQIYLLAITYVLNVIWLLDEWMDVSGLYRSLAYASASERTTNATIPVSRVMHFEKPSYSVMCQSTSQTDHKHRQEITITAREIIEMMTTRTTTQAKTYLCSLIYSRIVNVIKVKFMRSALNHSFSHSFTHEEQKRHRNTHTHTYPYAREK